VGGPGSGYRYSKKDTVEDSRELDIFVLTRKGFIRNGTWLSGTIAWTSQATGEQVASIGYEANTLDPTSAWMRLHYTITRPNGDKKDMDYKVQLEATTPNYGGLRWWFLCALTVNGRPTWRRVRKLYLPSGGDYFGCRQCYALTYESCQDSHKFDRMFAEMAADFPGMTGKDIKRMFRED
jgi:hypothetical protein